MFFRTISPDSRLVAMSAMAVFLAGPPLIGQIEVFEERERFSQEAIFLEHRNFRTGSVVNEATSLFGVAFNGEGRTSVRSFTLVLAATFGGVLSESGVRNESFDGSPNEGALIIDFSRPLSRVGFNLGNGAEGIVALIEVFNSRGLSLGTFEVSEIDEEAGPFVGIESQDPTGIAKIVVDYRDSQQAEQVGSVQLEFLNVQPFRKCVPLVGHGEIGGAHLQSAIRVVDLVNLQSSRPTRVRLDLFDDDGLPMLMGLNGEVRSTFEFELQTLFESLQLETSEIAELKAGYACVESSNPVGLDAVFQTTVLETGERFEAGIDARPAALVHLGSAEISHVQGTNVAIAVVNATDLENDVSVHFYTDGELFDSERFLLGPKARKAFFVTELLQKLREQELRGTMRILGSADIIATILRTRRGVAESSIALGTQQVFENPRE